MMKSEYGFYVTDAQKVAIRDVGLAEVEVSFSTSGMVHATVFEEYEVVCYTFRKDGGIVKETRSLDSEGWTTVCRDHWGKWIDDEGMEIIDG